MMGLAGLRRSLGRSHYLPQHGAWRYRWGFAWLPRRMSNGKRVWLQDIVTVERFFKDMTMLPGDMSPNYGWVEMETRAVE